MYIYKLRGFSPRATVPMSDRRLSAKLVPTFVDRGCSVVSATDPYGRIFGFLDWCIFIFLSHKRDSEAQINVPAVLYVRNLDRVVNELPMRLISRKRETMCKITQKVGC
jgi:hypothetical protein